MKNSVLVLAGGKSTRMKSDTPKVLMKIGEKTMIEHVIGRIEKSNIDHIAIIVSQFTKNLIKDVLGEEYQYVLQENPQGTGHAVMIAKDILKDKQDNLVVLNGDQPFTQAETINELIKKHEETGAIITMLTAYVPNFENENQGFSAYGRILRDDNGNIIAIREAKDCSEEERKNTEVNVAVYCFNDKWLWGNIENLQKTNVQSEYYVTDLAEMAISQGEKVESISITNLREVMGVNTQDDLKLVRNLEEKE